MDGKESVCNTGDLDSIPGSRRSPGDGNGIPLQFLPGEFHGQRSLASYSPWGRKESDTTERLTHTNTHTHMHYIEFIGNEIMVTGKTCYIDLLLVVSFIPEK